MTNRRPMPNGFKYWAFISYSHQDKAMARRLHEGLERYRVPRVLQKQLNRSGEKIPAHLQPVFRDRADLSAANNLTEAVKDALRQSHCLVVLCTENSADAKWVAKEVEYFRQLGRPHRIFCMIAPVSQPAKMGQPGLPTPELFPLPLRRPAEKTRGSSRWPATRDPAKTAFASRC